MDTLFILLVIIMARVLLHVLGAFLAGGKKWPWVAVVLLGIVGATTPIILLRESVIEDSIVNILISGFSFFYIPFVIGRLAEKIKKYPSGGL